MALASKKPIKTTNGGIKPIHPELITIPEGDYVIGINDDQVNHLYRTEIWAEEWVEKDLFAIEQPQHTVHLAGFQIGRAPVTNAEYFAFVWATGYRVPKDWVGFRYSEGMDNHPVVGVSRYDALAYCAWLNESLGGQFRLLNEFEWEAAARGGDDRIYPWGDDFDPWRCNTLESGKRGTTAVGEYSPSGDSPFGLVDMAGNVWEWTDSILQPYPYRQGEQTETKGTTARYVIRGGSWYYSRKLARTTTREAAVSTFVSPALGFRVGCNLHT